jgi:hypothetical protein
MKRDETKQGELFPPLPRAEARAWLSRVLRAAFPDQTQSAALLARLEDYGDSLFLIAEHFAIEDEKLMFWLRDQPKGKDWSLTAWREWCLRARAAAQRPAPARPWTEPAAEAGGLALCPRCLAHPLQRPGASRTGAASAWCAKCGEVEL